MNRNEADQRREAREVAQDMYPRCAPEDLKGEFNYVAPEIPVRSLAACLSCEVKRNEVDCKDCPIFEGRTFGELRAVRAICIFARALKLRYIDHIAGTVYLIAYPDFQHIGTWDKLIHQLPEVKNLFQNFKIKRMELELPRGKILVERITSMDN